MALFLCIFTQNLLPMLSEKQIYRLVMLYCRPIVFISGLSTLAGASTLLMVGSKTFLSALYIVTLLKVLCDAVSVVLLKLMAREREYYFYINIGQHPRKLLKMALCSDAVIYFTVCLFISVLRYVFNF